MATREVIWALRDSVTEAGADLRPEIQHDQECEECCQRQPDHQACYG